jgi:tetratricopeptide (TPR) repeat protein
MNILKRPIAPRAIASIAALGLCSFAQAAPDHGDAHGAPAKDSAHQENLLHSSEEIKDTLEKHEAGHGDSTHIHREDSHSGHRFDNVEVQWKTRLKEGLRLKRLGMDDKYEAILYELKGAPYPDPLRKDVYPLLEAFYISKHTRVKLVEVYEEFAEKYPNDPELPEIYFRLGRLYKEFGAFELAQDRFYKVLSTTIRGARNEEEQTEFRQKSLAAQIEVADLFLELGNYDRAAQFFDRLLRLEDLDGKGNDTNRARVEFKRAYATYYNVKDLDIKDQVNKSKRNQDFGKVISYLTHAGTQGVPYYEAYPDTPHAAESHYLLASIYKLMGTQEDKSKAHDEVVKLIDKANRGVKAKTIEVMEFDNKLTAYKWDKDKKAWLDSNGEEASVEALQEINRQIDLWVHWQKKAGNMLANANFEDGDTSGAIEIYQKMIGLDPTPKWQAPIVYQLGLCFERLGKAKHNPKAIEAYEILTNPAKNPESWGDWSRKIASSLEKLEGSDNVDDSLADVLQNQEQFIYRMAEWRLKNLRWNLAATSEIKRLEN